jgi:hypothetical protein
MVIAGTDASFSENENSFSMSWIHDNALGTTEIFIPKDFMQGKTLITVGSIQCDINRQIIVCSGLGGQVAAMVQ